MTFVSASLPPVESIAGTATLLATRLADERATEALLDRCLDVAAFAESAALAVRDRSDQADRPAFLAAADAFRSIVETLDRHPGIHLPTVQAVLQTRAPSAAMAAAETSLASLAEELLAALARLGELAPDLDQVAAALRAGLQATSAHISLTRAETDAGHLR